MLEIEPPLLTTDNVPDEFMLPLLFILLPAVREKLPDVFMEPLLIAVFRTFRLRELEENKLLDELSNELERISLTEPLCPTDNEPKSTVEPVLAADCRISRVPEILAVPVTFKALLAV